jgi:hypothetical protein
MKSMERFRQGKNIPEPQPEEEEEEEEETAAPTQPSIAKRLWNRLLDKISPRPRLYFPPPALPQEPEEPPEPPQAPPSSYLVELVDRSEIEDTPEIRRSIFIIQDCTSKRAAGTGRKSTP